MRIITILLIIAVLAGGGWYFLRGKAVTAPTMPPVAIKISPVIEQDVPLLLKEVGSVIAYETVSVRSRQDSQIAEVFFHDGDEVRQGDLLFQLDNRVLKAQLKQAQANLENNRLQFTRVQKLKVKGFESSARLDELRASFNAQKAMVENLSVQLEYSRILAPISGRAGIIRVTTGNTVKANDTQPLVTINQIKPVRVQFSLPQSSFSVVQSAMQGKDSLSVQVEHEGVSEKHNAPEKYDGILEHLDNNIDATSGTVLARAKFANENEKLWPGMFVNVSLNLGVEKNRLTIPEEAIQHGQTGDYVFVVDGLANGKGKAKKKPVKIARLINGIAVLADGLAVGESVVVDGLVALKDGGDVSVAQLAQSAN